MSVGDYIIRGETLTEFDDFDKNVPAGWPERVIELGRDWRGRPGAQQQQRLLGELWLLLNAAIAKYLRIHRERYGPLDIEDLRDIASEKSLEMLRKLDRGDWDPVASTPGQLCAFVSTLARNGLVDHLRVIESKRRRTIDPVDELDFSGHRQQQPDAAIDRDRFARALRECVSKLRPSTRMIWFLRVLLDMPSKRIARHPLVAMTPAAVDVALARCRGAVKKCMKVKGFDPGDMPPGTFTALWETLRHRIEDERVDFVDRKR